jgi:TonB family protein
MRITVRATLIMLVFSFCVFTTSRAQAAPQQQGPSPPPRQEDNTSPPKIIRKAGGVLQGSATNRVTPVYPPAAKEERVSGSVVVEVTIDEEGKVFAARAITGHALLKDAAVEAARGWTFTPTQLSGVPIKVIGTITFNFTLDPDPAVLKEIETYKAELRAKPGSADLYYKLGEAFTKLDNLKDAAEAYRQAVRFDAKSIPARKGLILTYAKLGEKEQAADELAKLKEIDPVAAEEVLKEMIQGAKR